MHSNYSEMFLGWAIADTYRNGSYVECESFVLPDSSARDRIIKRCEGLAVLLYGAETATSLEVNCVDATGNRHVLQFDETALRPNQKVRPTAVVPRSRANEGSELLRRGATAPVHRGLRDSN